MPDNDVDSKLAEAKKTLAEADKFSASLPKPAATPTPAAKPSYTAARQARSDGKELESIKSGLEWRAQQQKALQ